MSLVKTICYLLKLIPEKKILVRMQKQHLIILNDTIHLKNQFQTNIITTPYFKFKNFMNCNHCYVI